MTSAQKDVLVGVACFVTYKDPKDNQRRILSGRRAGSHGAGCWQLPGGHLDMFEEFNTCAQREVQEETNLDLPLNDIRLLTATNNIMWEERKHYVTVFMWCEIEPESIHNVKVMEPHKLQGDWEWLTAEELSSKTPLFSPLRRFIGQVGLDFLLSK